MELIKKIVIVGGGTSGWMAAAALANAQTVTPVEITLIESSQIGTIGVGEGSTPYLKHFMASLGFTESDWMSRCDASYKTGIYFDDWNHAGSRYFHPFYNELDVKPAEVFFHCANTRRRGAGPHIIGDDFFLSGQLAQLNLAPKPHKSLPVEPEYGYHFDAAKLAKVLKQFALAKGVSHLIDDVTTVVQDNNDNIAKLNLKSGINVSGDFFIDASGFRAVLIEQALDVPFESFAAELANDAAVAVSTQLDGEIPKPYTISKALTAGWMWRIPLTSRVGNGYVYSSAHLSPRQAELELAAELNIDADNSDFKHVNMKVGMRRSPWTKNVLAIGLSHSFVEPLEATALMVTQWGIESFVKTLTVQHPAIDLAQSRKAYNQQLTRLVLGVKEYIHAHYVTSQRRDSEYWRQVTKPEQMQPRLAEIMSCWRTGQDFDALMYRLDVDLAYFSPSWYALFAGMDYRDEKLFIKQHPIAPQVIDKAQNYFKQIALNYFANTAE
ncbi:tryptophan halogenase family protein [Shewanella fidelis]|uniref:Tryptophan 7-halogenase n=1 Tax=Shewanella fidelis TaxID=173509 RepID=A0AAW8NMB1_9GAMM|nr:tryptophan halogenase family protein [Shewanella fidelis]MDR8523440.1 tryptophan 7-halogenase [Shewanella fidelis]MDW4813326.1 tryptophan 7-halogenase [Shewanella fidelis]MDW4817302.1 tryptophan 7-halogenase [Shewanella fidelis]MDW4821341.1 tryptophan 7-halogenase [Shewanella fidelis]MDW4824581.1 tryptophan 7-halogenase [Shewanella fidelis]